MIHSQRSPLLCGLLYWHLTSVLASSIDFDAGFRGEIEWVRSQGGFIDPLITVGRTEFGGRGLFSTGPLEAGRVIMKIPKHLVMGPQVKRGDNETEWCDIALFVRDEILKGPQSL